MHLVDQACLCDDTFHFSFFFADLASHLLLEFDNRLNGFVGELKRLNHNLFCNLISAGFNHGDGFFCACHDQIQLGFFHLAECGVDDQFAIQIADADCANRARPGNIRDHQCSGSAINGQDIQRVFCIGREGHEHDLYFIAHAIWE